MESVLNTSAAVAGLLGVTIQITQASHRHISTMRSVPRALSYYLEELVCLKKLLVDVQDAFLFQTSTDLGVDLPLFALDLVNFQQELGRLSEKLHESQRTSGAILLKAIAWPFGEDQVALWTHSLSRYRHRIQSAIAVSSLRVQATTLEEVRMMRFKSEVQDKEATRLEIIDWVFDGAVRTKHKEITANHHPGTGGWILETFEVKEWIRGSTHLWCYGGPGVGKTHLVSLITNKLSPRNLTASFYCSYQAALDQTASTVAACLLRQLLEASPSIPQTATEMYRRFGYRQEAPRLDDISGCLSKICAENAPVYILVDALDEVGSSVKRGGILSLLEKLGRSGASVLVTSRTPSSERMKFLGNCLSLEVRSNVSDMSAYVAHMIDESEQLSMLVSEDAKTELVRCVVDRADKMFLLAALHCNHLCHLVRRSEVQGALESLPRGIDAAYEEAMRRIEADFPERRALALTVLSWIYHAKRALSADELLQALAIDPLTWQFNEEDVPSREIIIDACVGLVAIDSENRTARFAHKSVREYFQRETTYRRWFPDAKVDIARSCLSFLCRGSFDRGENPSVDAVAALSERYPLLSYAACHWGDHVREVHQQDIDGIALSFLDSHNQLQVAAMVIDAEHRRGGKYWGIWAPVSANPNLAVKLAARFGAVGLLRLLLARGADLRLQDAAGRTALHWAVRGGFLDAVLAILQHQQQQGVEVDARCALGRTPLQWAAKHGHTPVVRILIDCGADPAAESADGRTALHWAASQGHEAVVELLLDAGVDAEARSRKGWTALHWAACGGKRAIAVRGVVEDPVSEERSDAAGEEPFREEDGNGSDGDHRGQGHEQAAAMLLRAGVSPHLQTVGGQMAIDWAAAAGQTNLVRILAGSTVSVTAPRDVCGMMPVDDFAMENTLELDAVCLMAPIEA
ncbi:hypothetical protein GE09DRAFT_493396 [Coniochaeta sp. 2T2.1]|nr:hypothetical protein GE09DRAFT_493396 [Coniochaeta sp. 2T2.1]